MWIMTFLIMHLSASSCSSSLLGPNILLSTLFLYSHDQCSYPKMTDKVLHPNLIHYVLGRLFQRIHLKPCIKFHNMLLFSCEGLLSLHLLPGVCVTVIQYIHSHQSASHSFYLQPEGIPYLFSAFLSFMNDITRTNQILISLIL
jgi:hypothetical protein